MAKLKDALTAEAVRFQHTAENPGNSASGIKAARTRWENAHREYWAKVRTARDAVLTGKPIGKACVDVGGVEPDDVKEVINA